MNERALVSAFYVAIAMASLSLIGTLVFEWKSIKGKKMETAVGALVGVGRVLCLLILCYTT
ncbi:hypothetical protein B0H14DRAFT_2833927 [Mycena olivaceomarginata]|nr:hypothetical protein B0H14DRAFT_2833927 [Mycena olivaceomarginata]